MLLLWLLVEPQARRLSGVLVKLVGHLDVVVADAAGGLLSSDRRVDRVHDSVFKPLQVGAAVGFHGDYKCGQAFPSGAKAPVGVVGRCAPVAQRPAPGRTGRRPLGGEPAIATAALGHMGASGAPDSWPLSEAAAGLRQPAQGTHWRLSRSG